MESTPTYLSSVNFKVFQSWNTKYSTEGLYCLIQSSINIIQIFLALLVAFPLEGFLIVREAWISEDGVIHNL